MLCAVTAASKNIARGERHITAITWLLCVYSQLRLLTYLHYFLLHAAGSITPAKSATRCLYGIKFTSFNATKIQSTSLAHKSQPGA